MNSRQVKQLMFLLLFACTFLCLRAQSKDELRQEVQRLRVDSVNISNLQEQTKNSLNLANVQLVQNELLIQEMQSTITKLQSDFQLMVSQKNKLIASLQLEKNNLLITLDSIKREISETENSALQIFCFSNSSIEKYVFVDHAILEVNSNGTIRGYLGWAAQGMEEFFIQGRRTDGRFICRSYLINSEMQSMSDSLPVAYMEFEIEEGGLKFISGNYSPILTNPISFAVGRNQKFDDDIILYENPTFESHHTQLIYSGTAEVLKVGLWDVSPQGFSNIWYKIRGDNFTGWVFGQLDFFASNELTNPR